MASATRKTALVIGADPPSLVRFRMPLLREMQARGYQVHCAGAGPAPEVALALKAEGIQYHPIPLERTGTNPIADLKTLWFLRALCAQTRPDVLFAYNVKPVLYGLIAGFFARVPRRTAMIAGLGYAFTADRSRSKRWSRRRFLGAFARFAYRRCIRLSHCIIFQNPDDRETFRELGLLRAARSVALVNGSGVDIGQFAQAEWPSAPQKILLAARLLADKGIREYVEAARIIKSRRPDVVFRLAGPFDPNPTAISKPELEGWVSSDLIEYLGDLEDVRPAMRDAHVYVLPSYREGTPRTVLEAMATGRPVVTTDVPGCRQTTQDGVTGFLVPPYDAKTLAERIWTLLDDAPRAKAMGEAGRRRVESTFESRAVARATLDAFDGSSV
jgi:glycosyltransferase involved in cell wall biosynthesis